MKLYILFFMSVCLCLSWRVVSSLPNQRQLASALSSLKELRFLFRIPRSRSTISVTTISTTVITTNLFCASLVAVRGGCRKRKLSALMSSENDIIPPVIKPSNVQSIEITKLFEDYHSIDRMVESRALLSNTGNIIQPSMRSLSSPSSKYNQDGSPSSKLGFYPALYYLINDPLYTTVTSTTTSYVYTTTRTFTITNCIPQPFSYPVCTFAGK